MADRGRFGEQGYWTDDGREFDDRYGGREFGGDLSSRDETMRRRSRWDQAYGQAPEQWEGEHREEPHRYGGYYGPTERDPSYAAQHRFGPPRGGGGYDPHYLEWRGRQLAEHDRDYAEFDAERRRRADREFETWRGRRETGEPPQAQAEGEAGASPAKPRARPAARRDG